MAIDKITISGKLFPDISAIGESAGFQDFTPEELKSDAYTRMGSKLLEIDAAIAMGSVDNNEGKAALMAQIQADSKTYLGTIFPEVDDHHQHEVKVYVLNVLRLNVDAASVTGNTGDYVPKNDVFSVDARFDIHILPAVSLLPTEIKKLDATNFELKVSAEDDALDLVASVDVVFSSFSGPEPIPTEITIPLFIAGGVGEKTFIDSTFTFDDPAAAVGEDYTIIVELKNSAGGVIKSIEETVTVQPI